MRIESGKDAGKYILDRLFSASSYAYICSPYISTDYASRVVELAKNGVNLKVLTTNLVSDRNFRIRQYFHEEKGKHGLRNFSYLVMKRKNSYGIIHAKLYVTDDNYAVTGSANLTEPGMRSNTEIMHVSENANDVQLLKEVFEKFWLVARTTLGYIKTATATES